MNKVQLLGSALALTFALAACGQGVPSNTTQPATTKMSQAEINATSDALTAELVSSTSSLTVSNSVSALSLGSVSLADVQGSGLSAQALPPTRACVTADSTADDDADGILNNVTYTYNCVRDNALFKSSNIGTLKVVDAGAGNVGFDSEVNLTYTRTTKLNGFEVKEVRTGTRSPRKSGDKITQSHNITTLRQVTGQPDMNINNLWNLVFTATTPGSIVAGGPLPDGQATVSGSWSATRDGKVRSHTISTPVPLQYDPSCAEDLKIVGGTMVATHTTSSGTQTVTTVFGACGTDPTKS